MNEQASGLWSDGRERRNASDQIAWHGPQPEEMWLPARREVVIQFFTRYLFFVLGLLFFTAVSDVKPVLLGVNGILLAYGVYFVLVSLLFHQSMKGMSFRLERMSMLLDMVMVTFSVIHDPYQVPPSALAYLMVIFGNGMRYGMRPFLEALVAAMVGMALSFGFRYRLAGFQVSAADVFFGVFWFAITVYAYVLLGRINVQYRMLDFRSRCDNLTGLLNRKGLFGEVNKLFIKEDKGSLVILFADLNSFKLINDQYGHAAGDRVLTEFAQILKDSVETDIVGRWGGDEFVAAFQGGEKEVQEVMARVRRRLQLWSLANGLPVSASLGYSIAPRDGEDLVTLLSVADIALYQNKAVPVAKEPPPYMQAP